MSQGKLKGNRIDTEYYTPSRKDFLDNVWKSHFVKLKEIIKEWSYGILPPGNSYNDENPITFIRATEMSENLYVDFYNALKVPEKYYQSKRSRLQKWDILIAVKWATIASKKCIWFIDKEIPESIINGSIFRFQTIEWVYPKYVAYYLDSKEGKKQMKFSLVANNAVDYLNKDVIENLQIPLPSIEIQQQIVKKLDQALAEKQKLEDESKETSKNIDEYVLWKLGIELPEQQEEKMCFSVELEEVKNSRFDVFYNKPKFKFLENALKNSHFEIKKLWDFINDIRYWASVKNNYVEKWIPLLRIKDIKPNIINVKDIIYLDNNMREKLWNCFVYDWDFLISRSWTVWIVALVKKDLEWFAFWSFMIKFNLKEEFQINKMYISYWLNNMFNQMFIEKEKIWAIQWNITIDTIKNFYLPFPPIDIQNKIVDEVNNRIKEAKEKEQQAKEIYEKAKREVEEIILE